MIYQYQIAFSDVDFARVLFFGRYYEIVNRAAEQWFHQYDILVRDLATVHDLRLPIVASHCRYLGPLTLEDVVDVHLGVKDLTERGFTLAFIMLRQGEERAAAWGYLERRFVTGGGQARPPDETITRVLQQMADETRAFVEQVWEPLYQKLEGRKQ